MKKRGGVAAGVVAGVGVMGLVALSVGTPDGCAAEGLIGSEGGTISSSDGRLSLDIPEDALSSETLLAIEEVECDQPHEVTCYEITPDGVMFARPATATFEAAELASMEQLSLSVRGQEGWQKMADQIVDEEDEIVSASMMYTSTLSVQAE